MMRIDGIDIDVTRKHVKHLRVRVCPPDGRVLLTVPARTSDAHIREAVSGRIAWIKAKQELFKNRPVVPVPEYLSGERHALFGTDYILELTQDAVAPEAALHDGMLRLSVRPGASQDDRQRALYRFYGEQLHRVIPCLLHQWEPVVGKQAAEWGVKTMKTRWGSCNITARRIWLNTELAKKPPECLAYVLVHELVHLHERHHNARFYAHMDRVMPEWRMYKTMLDARLC